MTTTPPEPGPDMPVTNRTRPRISWTKRTDGWGSWVAEHAGHRLSVSRWGAGSWGWQLYRLRDDDPRWIVPGPSVASGRANDYRAGQRYAVDALLVVLG